MRYGCTLPLDLFTSSPSESSAALIEGFGSLDTLFSWLEHNLDAIELGTVRSSTDPELLLRAASVCHASGLTVTIHGSLVSGESPDAFFAPYRRLFEADLQDGYTVTLHPLADPEENRTALEALIHTGAPVQFALENQRNRSAETAGWGCSPVVGAVEGLSMGTCLDFGHQLSNFHKFGADFDPVSPDFYTNTVHTHIHSYYNGTTHFPLQVGETLLEEHITALRQANYNGILNLELHAERYFKEFDAREALVRSIGILKDAVTQIEYKDASWAAFRDRFPETLADAVQFIDSTRSGLALIGPASYLLRLGDKKFAFDPSACHLPGEEDIRALLYDTLRHYDGVISTHAHYDHYDGELLAMLAPHIPCYVANFMPDLPDVRKVQSGETLSFGEANFTFFESPHSRGENLVNELGFLLEYQGRRHLFPVDVRTYDASRVPVVGPVDTLISHLWLGRVQALDQENQAEYIEDFIAFANTFAPKKTIIGHLCDPRRIIPDMWSPLHVARVAPRLSAPTPLFFGDTIIL
ncbi:MAG: MBL fold metallo-hydrolase [Clostridia bacterium]|nr:MBL fold metallo-hydrolase [Clostridia bacterium]